ncbi:MAG: lamin tail domain-containing protein, partial [Verrucomicrobiota bacterium]
MKRSANPIFILIFFLAGLLAARNSAHAQANGIYREVYTGIGGVSVSDLTSSSSYPNNPSSASIITDFFEAPIDVDDNYGQRIRALVTAPTTGSYTFWISSDDGSVLYLSTDSNPSTKQQIASVSGWTSSREWTKEANQKSAPIALVAGQRYYIEALMKEGQGGDNLAARWQLPNGTIEEPIPASRLIPYGLIAPDIISQPVNTTVAEGTSATFVVQVSNPSGMSYQWQRNGANIAGATTASHTLPAVALSDSGGSFRCVLANAQGNATTISATLTVQPDTSAPGLVSVVNLGDNNIVTVLFSEAVDAVSSAQPSNYTINNGIQVIGAKFATDARTVILTTSLMAQGTTYTLTVSNVRDRASTPNTIAAGSQKAFSLDFTPLDIRDIVGTSEPLSHSSRRTGLIISEIMYHPTPRVDGKNLEFVEVYNAQGYFEDISGYRLAGAIEYTFPPNTTLAAGSFVVVAAVPADVQSVYGISGVFGGFTNSLQNSSGIVRLRNRLGAVLLEAKYSGELPFPAGADGAGDSLVLARPSHGEANPEAWAASELVGGSPGAPEPTQANPFRTVVINEFLAHTDDPELDFIELYNYGNQSVNVSGCFLTDDPSTNKFTIPAGTTIAAKGFLVFDQSQLGFALSAAGETIYFKNPPNNRVLDAIRFKGQANGVSTGRYPDGAGS